MSEWTSWFIYGLAALMLLSAVVGVILAGLALGSWRSFSEGSVITTKRATSRKRVGRGFKLIDGEKPGEGDWVWLKRTGEAGRIVYLFGVYPLKGDVVVLVGERRKLCSVEELEKVEA